MTNHSTLPSIASASAGFVAEMTAQREVIETAPFIGSGATLDKGLAYLTGIADYSIRLAASDDPLHPRLTRTSGVVATDDPASPTAIFRRNGLDNPDNDYLICSLDPSYEYELVGERGSTCEVNLQLLDGNYSDRVDTFATNMGILPSRDIDLGHDATMSIRLSKHVKTTGHSLHLPEGTKALMVRQSYADWRHESAGPLRVRRIGGDGTDQLVPDTDFWDRATRYLRNTMALWMQFGPGVDHLVAAAAGPKSLPFNSSRPPRSTPGGFPDQFSLSGRFILDDDQALVIDMSRNHASYHSVQLGDYWFTSLEYVHRQTSLNQNQYVVDDDGAVSVVVSRADPGVVNWLDTCDLTEGYFFIRWQGLPEGIAPDEPTISVVTLSDIAARLPKQRISSVERRVQLGERAKSFVRRETSARRTDWSSKA